MLASGVVQVVGENVLMQLPVLSLDNSQKGQCSLNTCTTPFQPSLPLTESAGHFSPLQFNILSGALFGPVHPPVSFILLTKRLCEI